MSRVSPQRCFSELTDLLQRQIDEICDLNAYLADIKSAVVSGNSDQLNQLTSQQQGPVEKLEVLEEQRRKLLRHNGFQSEKNDLLSCIHWCDQDSALTGLYQKFEQSLLELQRSLRVISLLINKNQKRVRRSLHLLSGQDISNRPPTYSASGIAEEINSGRSLARA